MILVVDIARTHVRNRLRQTVLSVAGVTTGVAFTIAMASLMQGSQRDFVDRIIDTTPHVTVRDEYREPPLQPAERVFAGGAVALVGLKPKEELRGIRNPMPKVATLDAVPGVRAAPTLRGQVVMRYGGRDVATALVGIEPRRERRVSNIEEDMVEGNLDALYGTANGVILGRGLASKLGARLGSTLIVSSPAEVLLRMKVVGLFHTGVIQLDDGTAYALLKKVQVLLDRPNVVNEIRLRLHDVTQARAVAERAERRFGYRAESWDEANAGVLEVFAIRNVIMYTVVGGILVVAAFGIFNIVSTITYEKARDIAILKSLGFTEGDIRTIFLLEGLLMGGAGTLLGWLAGYGLCRALGTVEFEVKGFTEMTGLPIIYEPIHYIIAGAAALGAAAIAGYLPARRAAKMDPVNIIRGAA